MEYRAKIEKNQLYIAHVIDKCVQYQTISVDHGLWCGGLVPCTPNTKENFLMADTTILRIRACASTGELEVEGPAAAATEWWNRLWPEVRAGNRTRTPAQLRPDGETSEQEADAIFGEYFATIRLDITDVDKALAAAVFAQRTSADNTFSTKDVNQLLLEQNMKLTNPSESVRRLSASKRAFVVNKGRFRVSAVGLEYAQSLERKET